MIGDQDLLSLKLTKARSKVQQTGFIVQSQKELSETFNTAKETTLPTSDVNKPRLKSESRNRKNDGSS